MKHFNTSLIIDQSLRDFLKKLEKLFSIVVDDNLVDRIFSDLDNDQVSEKKYLIYSGDKIIFKSTLTITAIVEEYEPETINIEIKNFNNIEYQELQSLMQNNTH